MRTLTAPPARVLPLALATFAAGTGEMVVAGVLPDVAADLDVGEAAAGQLVTVYAFTYGLGAPMLATLVGRWPARRTLLTALTVLSGLTGLCAVVDSFAALMALRALAALAAAAVTPTALAIAATVAPADRRGRYLALVTTGLTVSLLAGVPIGTWIGGVSGWQATMWFVALLTGLAAVTSLVAPRASTAPPVPLATRLALLRRPPVLRVVATTTLVGAGAAMVMTYLFPILRAAGGVDYRQVAVIYTCAGVTGALSAWLGGRGADGWGAGRTLVTGQLGHGGAMWLVSFMAAVGGFPVVALAAGVMAIALTGWAVNPPIQSTLFTLAPAVATEALALYSSSMFIGAALGGVIGGVVLESWSAAAVPLVGGALQFVALSLFPWSAVRREAAVAVARS